MDIPEVIALHNLEEPTSLIYIRASKRLGHCFIDPNKPLQYAIGESNYGRTVEDYQDLFNVASHDVKIGVYKQQNKVLIFVRPKDLYIHSKSKEQVIKVLYGNK